MRTLTCPQCGTGLAPDDMFCGECGTARMVTPDPPDAPGNTLPPPLTPQPGFFGHATAAPPEAGVMTNATRYLCAAAYIEPSFASRVIDEIVASHRAVAPSRGIDLEPVIRHCLKARRMLLTRDIVLGFLLLGGLIFAWVPLIFLLVASFFLTFIRPANWKRRSIGGRALAGLVIGGLVIVAGVGLLVVVALALAAVAASSLSSGSGPSVPGGPAASLLGPALVFIELGYLGLVAFVLLRYSYLASRTLAVWLGPDGAHPGFEPQSPRVENRIAEVRAAQYGNLTLYDRQDPFLGTGITPFNIVRDDEQVWSIVIELNRKGATKRGLLAARPAGVRLDPVDLHRVLRRRLLELNDPGLPGNERVHALAVDDQVVGQGVFPWDSPLIDPRRMIPYSQASQEAIDALIRNPQARLRHYQRVTISDMGQAVLAGPRPVIGSVDQEIIVSAFVHVAIEGHMFYLQFVPASLGPVDIEYHKPDLMPRVSTGRFLAKVCLDAASTAFFDITSSWPRSLRALRAMWRQHRRFSEELSSARDFAYADVGARFSVREHGSQWMPQSYLQRLDASKYTKIIERLVIETVLDYLDAHDVDTAAYRARAEAIYNSGTIIAGNNGGNYNINTGSGSAVQGTG